MVRHAHSMSLMRFLLFSSGLHWFFLLGAEGPGNTLPIHQLGQPVLNVELQYDARPLRQAKMKEASIRPSAEKTEYEDRTVIHDEKVSLPQPLPSAEVTSDEHKQEGLSLPRAELRNQLLGELQTRLSRYLVYPLLARERGWEGTVVLGLRVESNGHLDRIRVEQSSGYAVLDRSALNSLSRVGRLVEVSDWLDGRSMNMQLPVIYRLVEK